MCDDENNQRFTRSASECCTDSDLHVRDINVSALMREQPVVLPSMWFCVQFKHIYIYNVYIYFFRKPQHKQNQSPAVTHITGYTELCDGTLYLSLSEDREERNAHEYSSRAKLYFRPAAEAFASNRK